MISRSVLVFAAPAVVELRLLDFMEAASALAAPAASVLLFVTVFWVYATMDVTLFLRPVDGLLRRPASGSPSLPIRVVHVSLSGKALTRLLAGDQRVRC